MHSDKSLSVENERHREIQRLRPVAYWRTQHVQPNRKERAEAKAAVEREGGAPEKVTKALAKIEAQPRNAAVRVLLPDAPFLGWGKRVWRRMKRMNRHDKKALASLREWARPSVSP